MLQVNIGISATTKDEVLFGTVLKGTFMDSDSRVKLGSTGKNALF